MSEAPRVIVERIEHVAHVRLNRAEKRNGLDLPMFDALIATGERLGKDPSVRAIVLSGDGPAFCAGLDWKSFMASGGDNLSLLERSDISPANRAQRACWIWNEVRVPVIAAVHGVAFGGGFQLALAADIRLCRADSQWSAMEVRYGLVPDMSISVTLPRLVRLDVAKELVFTGRIFSGTEAVALGVATRLTDEPVAEALELAQIIARQSPQAVRAAKALLDGSVDRTVAQNLKHETDLQLTLLGSENQNEAVMAVFQKRAAVFVDPE